MTPTTINVKPSLKLHFDNIWAGTYGTFAKVSDKNDIYVFGLNNYCQLGKLSRDFFRVISMAVDGFNTTIFMYLSAIKLSGFNGKTLSTTM